MASLQVKPGGKYGQPPGIAREEICPDSSYSQGGDMVRLQVKPGN
jgi:hypothetical protein